MVYAIIYSLFLGFGLTIGPAIYGLIDHGASSETTCRNPIPEYWTFLFVPPFIFCSMVLNQARYHQMPVMMFIALCGWLVTHFVRHRWSANPQFGSTLGAFCVGVLANLYSRLGLRIDHFVEGPFRWLHRHAGARPTDAESQAADPTTTEKQAELAAEERVELSEEKRQEKRSAVLVLLRYANPMRLFRRHTTEQQAHDADVTAEQEHKARHRHVTYALAAAAMLPAIWVQVPGGLALGGALLEGISTADSLTLGSNATATNGTTTTTLGTTGGIAFNVGYKVVQVALGITIGLFLGSVVVYPAGKGGKWGSAKRSGLFSL